MYHPITVTVNGEATPVIVPSHMTLLDMLRNELAMMGTKNGCAAGECGACTVLMDGEPVNACLVLAVETDGHNIVTVEGLAKVDGLHPLQAAIIERAGTQCGFCTPGILIAAKALLDRTPHPSEWEIREALVGNLCRCTGYTQIIEAIRTVATSNNP